MKKEDMIYLCRIAANMSGIPVRLYRDKKEVFSIFPSALPVDPFVLYLEKIFSITDPIGYYMDGDFFYYGFVRSAHYRVIIGPCRELAPKRALLRKVAFELNLSADAVEDFLRGMENFVCFPLLITLQLLCALDFGLNGTRRNVREITIHEEAQNDLTKEMTGEAVRQAEFSVPSEMAHNTLAAEQIVCDFIKNGDPEGLSLWASAAPALRPGTLSEDQLRQFKNTFIVTATLVSRAAIDGGMNSEDALSLSDSYIRKCEALHEADRITNLQFHMLMDYATEVSRLRLGDSASALVRRVADYVHRHLSEPIKTEEIARSLYLSRGHLSTTFKKETGATLINYIQSQKIEEAKRLLKHTDKSLLAISAYLGFSSQSHFSSVFQKVAGVTPSEYRKGSF